MEKEKTLDYLTIPTGQVQLRTEKATAVYSKLKKKAQYLQFFKPSTLNEN
jgi:hypothetical protein